MGCWSARRSMHCSSTSTSMLSIDLVAGDDLRGLVGVALEQRLHRQPERGLGLAAHGEEPHLDLAQLVVKVPVRFGAHPNLPVM